MDLWDAIGCPYCQGRLATTGKPVALLQCAACGQGYALEGRCPVLFRREDHVRLQDFAQKYQEARQSEGWQPPTREQALSLPYSLPAGTPALYWQVRRQSFCALMGVLAREGPTPAHGPAVDLGAGTGWLSYRLAQVGYGVLAVDASRDEDWGLGAAELHYLPQVHFQLVLGDLEHPPLQAEEVSLIVFNASLHYASDLAGTLARAARALKPGGRIIILDAPIARRPSSGTGQGDRHLGQQELEGALLAAGLNPRWIAIRRGSRWWCHQAKAILRRDALFSFPMIVADQLP
jgi:SAM-dependent methyltransferase